MRWTTPFSTGMLPFTIRATTIPCKKSRDYITIYSKREYALRSPLTTSIMNLPLHVHGHLRQYWTSPENVWMHLSQITGVSFCAFYFTTYNNLFVLVLKSTNFVGVSWQMIFLLIGVVHEALFHIWPPAWVSLNTYQIHKQTLRKISVQSIQTGWCRWRSLDL